MTLHWKFWSRLMLLAGLALLQGCISGQTTDERRAAVRQMQGTVLRELYAEKPDVREQIESAAGYAVFSNANVNLMLASFGGGYGLLHNNDTGKDTYLRMGEVGVGLGMGVKDFRVVLVFHTDDALHRFEEYGVSVGAQADAAAKASDQGAAVGGELALDNITVYQLTESGLALQATLKGSKYWPDRELN